MIGYDFLASVHCVFCALEVQQFTFDPEVGFCVWVLPIFNRIFDAVLDLGGARVSDGALAEFTISVVVQGNILVLDEVIIEFLVVGVALAYVVHVDLHVLFLFLQDTTYK